jgi:plastocyanin
MARRPIAALAVVGLVAAGAAWAADTPLSGSVGPGFSISVLDAQGARVSSLAPGAYSLTVNDQSDEHNLNLSGPGVDVATDVGTSGTTTFQLTLVDGTYMYLCNAHPTRMRGQFTVGSGGGTPPPPPPPTGGGAPRPSAAIGARLVLTAGPGATITFRTSAGKAVKLLRPGAYTIFVRDRTAAHNVHLVGAGVNRKTGKGELAAVSWKVSLRKGALVFRSDFKKVGMRGTVTVA